ncbi:diacylglycerol/polyprenol kinase family protein [Anaerolinea thermophila]|uniref:Phosphatidate cytidylyltransferase n=1 Tax=Anaerolinea thermophila (strain DSM 14523 / JCM 11388 / NBRC 100420 / UNI-1) TaxID=926569 RepID=E8N614_ANATU|nr:phosphatidate cytidylyltransferase [Anaerolinea thermophila]BAJ63878.1 putative phosphatidate cytidylyltransferase [Anaerolinea thermophila UNI-1]
MNEWMALGLTFGIALLWLRVNDYLAYRGWVSSSLSRKIIHLGTGPIFVLCWLFFPNTPLSKWLAALVPLLITLQFFLVGTGWIRDPQAVSAMSRTGDRREILRGPLYYGVVFVLLTLIFWKDSPIGVVALMILSGGDGLADIIGKRFPSSSLAWSPRKTVWGSLSVFVGGVFFSILVLSVFRLLGVFQFEWWDTFLKVVGIGIAATVVESLPFQDIDNLTVPLVSVFLGYFLF